MKDVDEVVERVLRELGGAEAPEGMERRVLARVEAAAVRTRGGRFGGSGFAAMPWAGPALAAAVLLMVVGGFVWRGERAGHGATAVVATRVTSSPAGVATADTVRGRASAAVERRRELTAGRRRELATERVTARASGGARVTHGSKASVAALQNRPAPEEPLTAEERMLLRIARRGRPEEYAALDPGVDEARMSAEKVEFRKFFEPPTVVTGERN